MAKETNIDEAILTSQRVDINSEIPIIDQVLRIAVYDEFKAYENYTKIIEKFGSINPFANIRQAEAQHYSMLISLLQQYEIEVPVNDWADKLVAPDSLIQAYELGVAGEIRNIQMYDNLISHLNETQSDIKDVLFRLQAASYNNHLPTFRRHVIDYYTHQNSMNTSGFSQQELSSKIQEYQELFNDIQNGNIDENKISQLLSKVNLSMISGAGIGAVLTAFLNNYTQNQTKEN